MTLKLYIDLMSQPSRALYILLKVANCDFEPKMVALRKAEHLTEEFAKINRFQKVPVIDHDGFVLTESVAIMKYLSRENLLPESLYPKDSKKAARVEEFLAYQHIGLRLHCAMFFRVSILDPMIQGRDPDQKQIESYKRRMINALEEFDTKWLGQGHAFITGDKATVADLLAACELEQPRMAGFNPMEQFSNIGAWHKKVKAAFDPFYEEAHAILNKIAFNKGGLSTSDPKDRVTSAL